MQAILFMSCFAALWWSASLAASGGQAALVLIGPVVSVAVILVARRRLRNAPALEMVERKRIKRVVGWSVLGEGAAMFIAFLILRILGLGAYIFPAMVAIVGLHFLPLAAFLKVRSYWMTAAGLVLLGATGVFLDPPLRALVVGMTAAAILWATCLALLAEQTPRLLDA